MLHTKFQASKPSGSEEDSWIFFYVFLWFEPKPPHVGSQDLYLNKLGKGLLGNATYWISGIWAKWLCRRRFFNIFNIFFLYIFLWFEPRTSRCRTILDPQTFILLYLIKDHYAMLHTKFPASKPSNSEEEDFFNIFYVFLWFEPRTPCRGAIFKPGTFIWTNLVKDHEAIQAS